VRITHSGQAFKAIGEVTGNITATGMGIVFTEIEASDRTILKKWLGQGAQE
jgi:hypothetical protein